MSTADAASSVPTCSDTPIRGNQILSYASFILVSWVVATIALLVTNKRREPALVILVLVFFAFQAIGAIASGVWLDMRGRKSAFRVASVILFIGLYGIVACCYFCISSHPITAPSSTAEFSIAFTEKPHELYATLPPAGFPSPSGLLYAVLAVSTAVAGISVGAFYPIVGVVIVESVGAKTRILHVASLFCMQGIGHLLARCVAAVVFHHNSSATIVEVFYFLMLGAFAASAIISLLVHLFVEETSSFLNSYASGSRRSISIEGSSLGTSLLRQSGEQTALSLKKYCQMVKQYSNVFYWDIIGTSIPWLLFDCIFYGDGVFDFLLIQRIKGFDSDVQENSFTVAVSSVCLIGYVLAAVLVLRIIPKLFQILGFTVLAFVFFGLALSLYSISHATDIGDHHSISEFLGASLMYDCFFRFFNFIPNLTTFLIPLDAFPTKVRGSFVGFAVFASRVGAVSGMLISWLVFEVYFNRAAMLLFSAALAVVGAAVTRIFTPHVMPAEEDLKKLDIQYLTRLCATRRAPMRARSDTRLPLEFRTAPLTDGPRSVTDTIDNITPKEQARRNCNT